MAFDAIQEKISVRWPRQDGGSLIDEGARRAADGITRRATPTVPTPERLRLEQRLRAQILDDLIIRLPDDMLPKALAVARTLDHGIEKARVLVVLTLRLENSLWDEALQEILELPDADAVTWALVELSHYMPETFSDAAIQAVRTLQRDEQESDFYTGRSIFYLARLAGYVPEEESRLLVNEALSTAAEAARHKDPPIWDLIEAAAMLSEDLRPQILRSVLGHVRKRQEPYRQVSVLRRLSSILPEAMLYDALEIAVSIREPDRDDEWKENYRADAITALGQEAPAERLGDLLVAIHSIEQERLRIQALGDILRQFVHHAALEDLNRAWRRFLESAAQRPRALLLGELDALGPLITKLAGPEAAWEGARAVQDVARWWP